MASDIKHARLPYCVRHAKFTVPIETRDSDGALVVPSSPDTELSIDGAAFADCAEEVSAADDYLTLSGAETNASLVRIQAKSSNGLTGTLKIYPRDLPTLASGTAQAGGNATITLANGAAVMDYTGCIVRTTGGTGGGGTGGASNQARQVLSTNVSTPTAIVLTVAPNWETNPSSDTTYDILFTDLWTNANLVAIGRAAADLSTEGDLATATRDAILDRVLSGNHDVAGSLGALVPSISTQQGIRFDGVDSSINGLVSDVAAVEADTDVLISRVTESRAGYWDNLNVGGVVASQADITALNQSASRRILLSTVQQYERPESGSTAYTVEARTYSDDGAPMDASVGPTLTATGSVTGSLAANLSSSTNPATGVYRWTYTVANNATEEQIRFDFSGTVDGDALTMGVFAQVVNMVAATFTTADRTKLEAVYNKLPSKDYLAGTANSDGDIQASEMTGNFPGSVGSVVGNLGGNVVGSVASVVGHTPQTGDTYALANGVAGFVATKADTAAVKAKTDQLAFGTANRVNAQVYGLEAGVVTATSIADNAITAAKLHADVTTEIAAGVESGGAQNINVEIRETGVSNS